MLRYGLCETFIIDPVQPVVNTVIQTDSSTVNGPIVHDVATVDGVAGLPPTGEVTFTFFHNSSCTPDGSSVSSNGLVGGSATSASVGPLAPGSYSFLAHYDPDGDTNYRAADGPCESLLVNATQTGTPPTIVVSPARIIVVQPAPQYRSGLARHCRAVHGTVDRLSVRSTFRQA